MWVLFQQQLERLLAVAIHGGEEFQEQRFTVGGGPAGVVCWRDESFEWQDAKLETQALEWCTREQNYCTRGTGMERGVTLPACIGRSVGRERWRKLLRWKKRLKGVWLDALDGTGFQYSNHAVVTLVTLSLRGLSKAFECRCFCMFLVLKASAHCRRRRRLLLPSLVCSRVRELLILKMKSQSISCSPLGMSFFAEVLPAFAQAGDTREFKQFLVAMQTFLPFFDRMGSMFKIVKSDIGGNVDKLSAGTAALAANVSFSAVIDADIAAGKNAKSGGSNAESLLWLKRAMEFIILLLSKVSETKDEVKKCAQDSYEVSLGKHHNFIVRKTTSAMMGTAPNRADLIANLGPRCAKTSMPQHCNTLTPATQQRQYYSPPTILHYLNILLKRLSRLNQPCSEAVVVEDMKRWVAVVNPMIQNFVKYYAEKKLEY
jgi:hypothetical protein